MSIQYILSAAIALRSVYNARSKCWNQSMSYMEGNGAFFTYLDSATVSKTRTYLVCHDSSYFLTLFDVLNQSPLYGWTIQRAIITCPPCIVSLRKGNKTVTILDILNIWPTLSLGTTLGENVQPSADEHGDYEQFVEIKPLLDRAQRMSAKMLDWWEFLKVNDLGGFSPTIGTQSVRVWRHRFMRHQVVIDCHDDALALARSAVYGGRVECFRIGKFTGKFYQLDVNACYPFIMSTCNMPTRIRFWTKHGSIDDLVRWTGSNVCVAQVTVRTYKPCYPYRNGHLLMFPTGTFTTVLAGSELRSAVERGDIRSVEALCVYDSEPCFQEYMSALWIMRQECKRTGNLEELEKWKLLSNSFAGKWAQRGGHWENSQRTDDLSMKSWTEIDFEENQIRQFRQFGGLIQEKGAEKESQESHPAIAATITAGARSLLYRHIETCGRENVYYCDTDSLVVSERGYLLLADEIDSTAFGKLKVQGVYDTCEIINSKHYKLGNVQKFSGVPREARDNGQGVMDFMSKPHLDEQIRGNSALKVVGVWLRRVYDGVYRKGLIQKDGRVKPVEV